MRLVLAICAVALVAAASATAATPAPVIKLNDDRFGDILARRDHQALYYWNRERDGKVRCTGACAAAWPPLTVRKSAFVPRSIAGVKGTFGVVRRPDGKLQLTHNRRPLYTYAHERPNEVLCDDVNGWFVVRV